MRNLLLSLAALLFGLSILPAGEPQILPIPPRIVKLEMMNSRFSKVAPALSRSAGIPFTFPESSGAQNCEAPFAAGKPFWEALELVADQTGNRIVLNDAGRKIALVERGKSRETSSIAGPFRIVAERVTARYLLEEGATVYDILLNIHWEPRFPVFRLDAEPTLTRALDDRGTTLRGSGAKTRSHPDGAALYASTVRLSGLTRESRKIATLEGHFTVTASASMLTFRFPDLSAKMPLTRPAQENITPLLKRFVRDENTWEAELELTYPPTLPTFESFESWTGENRARLVSPTGKIYTPEGNATNSIGNKVSATYYFKEDPAKGLINPTAKGWSLVYDAPSTPLEFTVPFVLKDIPLP